MTTRSRWFFPLLALAATLAALGAFVVAYRAHTGAPGGPTARPIAGGADMTGFAIAPPKPAPDFAMPAHTGGTLRLSDLRGQAVLLFFGYTYCPDICPTTLARLVGALNRLGDDAERVTVVFVTVDPGRDTLPALARYLGNFSPRIVGLRGDEGAIARTAADYAVTYSVDHPDGATPDPVAYTVSHSGYVFLIDPSGRQRSAFVGDFTPEDVEHDVRLVLDEGR